MRIGQLLQRSNKHLSCTEQTARCGGANVQPQEDRSHHRSTTEFSRVAECLVSLAAVGLPNKSNFFVHSSSAACRLSVLPWY
jgi:hypothetical protein